MRKGAKNAQVHQQAVSNGWHVDLRDPMERETVLSAGWLARSFDLNVGDVRDLKKR